MLENLLDKIGFGKKSQLPQNVAAPEVLADEMSAIDIRNKVIKELKNYRANFEGDWKIFENFYYGKHHKTGEDRKTTKNHVFRIVETEVPIMCDSLPGTVIITEDESRENDGKMLESGIKYVYNDQNLQLLLPSLIRDALIAAPGLLFVYYDPSCEKGQGAIRFKQVDWRNIYLDGSASTIDDSKEFVYKEPMRESEAIRLWPEHKEAIENDDGEDMPSDNDGGNDASEQYEDRDLTSNGRGEVVGGRPKDFKADDSGIYYETWIRSYDMEPIPMGETVAEIEKETNQIIQGQVPDVGMYEDHDTHISGHTNQRAALCASIGAPPDAPLEAIGAIVEQIMAQYPDAGLDAVMSQIAILDDHIKVHEIKKEDNPKGERPKYIDGWRVIKTYNNVELYDGPNPPQIDEIPLVPWYAYKDKTVYGFGEVKNIHSPQTSLNEMDHKEYKGLKRVANPGWMADKESGVTEEKLSGEDGIVVIKPKNTEVKRLDPGNISPQLAQRQDRDELSINKISGIREETSGAMPSPNASGFAINKLQLQSVGRIRLKDRLLAHYSMKRLGRITSKFILAHWNAEKQLRFRTDDNQIHSFFFDPVRISDLKYKFEISEGSMAGIDKDSLNNLFAQFLAAGHITFDEFLAVADIPKKSILAEMAKARTDKDAQIAELQKQVIQIKGAVNPQLLSPDEQQIYTEMQRQAMNEQLINGGIGSLQQANPTSGQGV